MKIRIEIIQGIRCLLMHRLRTFLSTLGVLFGVMAMIAMLAIGEGSRQEILNQIEQLGTNNIILRHIELSHEQKFKAREAMSFGLTLEDSHLLAQNVSLIQNLASLKIIQDNIRGISPEISPEILAITPSFKEIKRLEISEGRFICDLDVSKRQHVCVLGAEVAKIIGKGGHTGQYIRIGNLQFQIIGILNNKNWIPGKTKIVNIRNLNKSVFIPLGVEQGFPRKTQGSNDFLSEIILQLINSEMMVMSTQAIKRVMELKHHKIEDYQMIVPQELLNQAFETQNIFNLVLGCIAAISMLVGGIGIMNIMLASVSDRTREIGIRRALGASQFHIAKQFLLETLILSVSGACLGLLGGIFFSQIIGSIAGWNVVITGWSVFLSIMMAIVVGMVSGVYPAIKAASMDPIAALKYV